MARDPNREPNLTPVDGVSNYVAGADDLDLIRFERELAPMLESEGGHEYFREYLRRQTAADPSTLEILREIMRIQTVEDPSSTVGRMHEMIRNHVEENG